MATMSKSKSRTKVFYMAHDWPEDMHMTDEAFAEYATKIEKDDFEDDVRGLCSTLHQLVSIRTDTIEKLRLSADYLDSVWFKCRVGRSLGTSASVVGGSLTIAGGILTLATAGGAAPLLIAGLATGSVGAATNIGSSVIERIINSKQVRDMSSAFQMDKELTLKIESQVDDLRRYKDSAHLGALLVMVEQLLGAGHILMPILNSVFRLDSTPQGLLSVSHRFFSHAFNTIANKSSCPESKEDEGSAKDPELKAISNGAECLVNDEDFCEKAFPISKKAKAQAKANIVKGSSLSTGGGQQGSTKGPAAKIFDGTTDDDDDDEAPLVSKDNNGSQSSAAKLIEIARAGREAAKATGNLTDILTENPKAAACAVAGVVAAGSAVTAASTAFKDTSKVTSKATASAAMMVATSTAQAGGGVPLKYNAFGPDIFLETSKVVGQNSTRLAGQVIIGVSAAFLVWDTIDLGLTVADLIRKKGSNAARILRSKADELESALEETRSSYSLEMMPD